MEPFSNNQYIDVQVFEENEPQETVVSQTTRRPGVKRLGPGPIQMIANSIAEFLSSVGGIMKESSEKNRARIARYQKNHGAFSQKHQAFWETKMEGWAEQYSRYMTNTYGSDMEHRRGRCGRRK